MNPWLWLLIVLVALALLWWASASARRLDRLHKKVFAARASLEVQLLHRGAIAAHLATAQVLDPASAVLVGQAAWEALFAGGHGESDQAAALIGTVDCNVMAADRSAAESDLSAVLREILTDEAEVRRMAANEEVASLLKELAATWQRVHWARRFHNDAVVQAQYVRSKLLVRILGLAGHAILPTVVEFDDGIGKGLQVLSGEQAIDPPGSCI